MNDIINL